MEKNQSASTATKMKRYRLALKSGKMAAWAAMWHFCGTEVFFDAMHEAASGLIQNGELIRGDNKNPTSAALDYMASYYGISREFVIERIKEIQSDSATILQPALQSPSTQFVPKTLDTPRDIVRSDIIRDNPTVSTSEDIYIPTAKKTLDIIAKMSDAPTNQLIIGIPGSGKGLTVSNALRAIKAKHPHIKIFYIDPKNDSKETGYFQGCVDILKRASTSSMEPEDIAEWFKNCIREFDGIAGDKLLILDEGTQIGSQLKIAKQMDWLKGKLTSYASCGDSAGLNVWIIAQNPHTDDLGISGGLRSQFCPLAIVSAKNIAAYGAMIATSFIPSGQKISDVKVQEYIDNSPVKRAVYHGGLNAWFPMPKLENYSGFDRDTKTFADGTPTRIQSVESTDVVSMLERSFNNSPSQEKPLTDLAEKILEIINSSDNDSMSFNAIRTSRKWHKRFDTKNPLKADLEQALSELLKKGLVTGDETNGYICL